MSELTDELRKASDDAQFLEDGRRFEEAADEIERLEKLVEEMPAKFAALVYVLKDRYDDRNDNPEIEALVRYHAEEYERNKSAGMSFMNSAEKALASTFSKALR